jgi:error-prone DNA polymerase
MQQNGISPEAQEEIVLSITSFALYGFPESHAASFALIAYASAYLKCHYLAAFTAALLNNQPMGFYHPATIVKDAQRHGLKVLPIDVTKSDWNCTLEPVVSRPSSAVSRALEHSAISTQHSASLDSDLNKHALEVDADPPTNSAAKRQKDVAHGVSREFSAENIGALEGRKNNHNPEAPELAVRLGLRYTRGLRQQAAQALVGERKRAPFTSVHDLVHRVPELRKDELVTLAEIGALNSVGSPPPRQPSAVFRAGSDTEKPNKFSISNCQSPIETHLQLFQLEIGNRHSRIRLHRRDALWQVERAVRFAGPLLEELPEPDASSPLKPMNHEERMVADFHGTGLTIGPHPMAYRRSEMDRMKIRRACDLNHIPNGKHVRIGGCVIARQRPGTAHGFVFLSIEDETGIANAIITPDLLQKNRVLVISERFLMVEGTLQNQDNVISVKAERVLPLFITSAEMSSHDFY